MWRSDEEAIRMLDRLQCAEAFRRWVEAFYEYRLGCMFEALQGPIGDADRIAKDEQEMNEAWSRVQKMIRTQSENVGAPVVDVEEALRVRFAADVQAGNRCCRCLVRVTPDACYMMTEHLVACYPCFTKESPLFELPEPSK